MGTRERIIDYIRSNGPSTYAEIASRTSIDSIFVSAVLGEAWRNREVLRTKKFKSGRIYYLEEQKDRVREKIWNNLRPKEREIIQELTNHEILIEEDLKESEIELVNRFSPFFDSFEARINGRTYKCWKYYKIGEKEAKRILKEKFTKKKKGKEKGEKQIEDVEEEEETLPREEKGQKEEDVEEDVEEEEEELDFKESIIKWFNELNAKIREEEVLRKNKEIRWVVSMPVPFGKQEYFIKAKKYKKRSINEKDISLAYAAGLGKKMPVIYISSTGFTKKAIDFWKEHYKGIVTLMNLEDVRKS